VHHQGNVAAGEREVLQHARMPHRQPVLHLCLLQVYHLPINEAAAQLQIGVTVLKKYCRRFKV
jgi:hypothetical protein